MQDKPLPMKRTLDSEAKQRIRLLRDRFVEEVRDQLRALDDANRVTAADLAVRIVLRY